MESIVHIVTAGSYDILHKGHRSVLMQIAQISNAFGNNHFDILVWSQHLTKNYLLTIEERRNSLLEWCSTQSIKAHVHCFPVIYKEGNHQSDLAFENLVGRSRYDPHLLLLTGIKETDINYFQNTISKFKRNSSVLSAKIAFLVSENTHSQYDSSSKIRNYLIKSSYSESSFQDALVELRRKDCIDHIIFNLLLGKRSLFLRELQKNITV